MRIINAKNWKKLLQQEQLAHKEVPNQPLAQTDQRAILMTS